MELIRYLFQLNESRPFKIHAPTKKNIFNYKQTFHVLSGNTIASVICLNEIIVARKTHSSFIAGN